MEISAITKSIVNVLTVLVTAGPWVLDVLHVFPGGTAAAAVVSSVLGIAGTILHYLAPNQTVHPAKAAKQSVRLKKQHRPSHA